MKARRAPYRKSCSDSDSESVHMSGSSNTTNSHDAGSLPPLPRLLNKPANSLGHRVLELYLSIVYKCLILCEGAVDYYKDGQPSRVRSFPHMEGNYALYVYIPVFIPPTAMKGMCIFLRKVASLVPGLHMAGIDVPLDLLCKDDNKLQEVALGREFHVSLARTVPIRDHQIDSVVTMLRKKLQHQKRYLIDFSKWEVFVNDDHTRTFISMEVIATGLAEIIKQIQAVNGVYKLHNLPEFYKVPRPHISLAWAVGDICNSLKCALEEERRVAVGSPRKCMFTSKFNGIKCRVGKKVHKICKFSNT